MWNNKASQYTSWVYISCYKVPIYFHFPCTLNAIEHYLEIHCTECMLNINDYLWMCCLINTIGHSVCKSANSLHKNIINKQVYFVFQNSNETMIFGFIEIHYFTHCVGRYNHTKESSFQLIEIHCTKKKARHNDYYV